MNKIIQGKKLVLRSQYTKELYTHNSHTFFRPEFSLGLGEIHDTNAGTLFTTYRDCDCCCCFSTPMVRTVGFASGRTV